MTVVFDYQSAAITTDTRGSEAILSITPTHAILNLKRNNGLILNGTYKEHPDAASSAIKIVGTVRASMNAGDNLDNWDVHFIQLISESTSSYYYAGTKTSDGCMILDTATSHTGSGALTGTDYMLDSDKNTAPFTNPDRPTILTMPNPSSILPIGNPSLGNMVTGVAVTMDDHPTSKMPLWVKNFASGHWNIIIRAQSAVDFYTAFVIRDKSASALRFTILGYVQWFAVWDFSLTHSRSRINFSNMNSIPNILITPVKHNFDVSLFVPGPPQDTDLARQIFIASARDPMYNDEAYRIQTEALHAKHDLATVTAFKQWDARADHPPQHFTP
jgi:hypothetical protein